MEIIRENLSHSAFELLFSGGSKRNILQDKVVLTFTSKNIPQKKIIHAPLPHRPIETCVCLIVKDLARNDHDRSAVMWKDKLYMELKGSEHLKASLPPITFMPLHELKVAYQTFSSKKRLLSTFDVFMADKRIIHYLPNKLGKAFYTDNSKIPLAVSIERFALVKNVLNAFHSCQIMIHGLGSSESVSIGNTDMPVTQLKDNILSVVNAAITNWPGGLDNLRSISMKAGSSASVPVHFDASDTPVDLVYFTAQRHAQTATTGNHRVSKRKVLSKPSTAIPVSSVHQLNRLRKLVPQLAKKDPLVGPPSLEITRGLMRQVAQDLPVSPDQLNTILYSAQKLKKPFSRKAAPGLTNKRTKGLKSEKKRLTQK